MADPEELDEDLFADLYEGDDVPSKPAEPSAPAPTTEVAEAVKVEPTAETAPEPASHGEYGADGGETATHQTDGYGGDADMNGAGWNGHANQYDAQAMEHDDNYGPINVKEDGKMFIGGLNWETTEESLKNYFSQFGEVSECTVMRDSATGRSRGFGFLTFRDPKCVNIVMVKEHYLDGKIIDPKRAIPREEQERTSKIFVGGVSQEATEDDFKNFFKQFGRVVDATLMMDKDTGRPRGFGFVTFDGDAAVDATLRGPLQILGKPIEVKRAQPRGNMRDGEEDNSNKKFSGRGGNKYGGRNDSNAGFEGQQDQNQQAGGQNGMTPAMMAQYWQRMQQYFQQMQQQLAGGGGMPTGPMGGMPPGGGMNPAMMQGMMAAGMNRPTGSPLQQGPMNGMNPAMMQQMQQMQQMQMQGQQGGGAGGYGANPMMGGPRPAYNAQEQMAFEQQKYEQQQQRRMQQQAGYGGQGGPTSWEGMYDDIPQPSIPAGPGRPTSNFGGSHGGGGRGNNRGRQGSSQPPNQPSNAPANAPTGPKNAGKPGANYRGGGRNSNFRHNPYGGGRG